MRSSISSWVALLVNLVFVPSIDLDHEIKPWVSMDSKATLHRGDNYVGIPHKSIFSANGTGWLKSKIAINEGVLGECGASLVIKPVDRL